MAKHEQHDHADQGQIDPVCGMTVDPHATPHRAQHKGIPYYFCSAGCRGLYAPPSGVTPWS